MTSIPYWRIFNALVSKKIRAVNELRCSEVSNSRIFRLLSAMGKVVDTHFPTLKNILKKIYSRIYIRYEMTLPDCTLYIFIYINLFLRRGEREQKKCDMVEC